MNTIKINSLEDLQQVKANLRAKINSQEQVLKQHYVNLSDSIKPALNIANLITGNKLFKKAFDNESNSGWLSTAIKLVTAVSAGGFLLNRSKKNLAKALLAYALDQGVKYIQQNDITEHIEKLKQWLNKNEKDAGEAETETVTEPEAL